MARRTVTPALALLAGVVHAALVVGVALEYGYDVGPSAYPVHGVVWRYGGLVLLGALPVWLALEDGLVLPLALVAVLAGLAFHAELTPPAPTFHDVADLERSVDGPTGITVVENGLHLVKYASAWYAWAAGAGLLGLWEHAVRSRRKWLPAPTTGLRVPSDARGAVALAGAAGLVHALASLGFAWGRGIADGPLVVLWLVAGGVLLLGVPVYLLAHHGLVWPTAVATLLFLNSIRSQQYAGAGDPHALYAAGWFVFLGVALVPGLLEYGLRRLGDRLGGGTSAGSG